MHMADCGIRTDPKGNVGENEFVQYRRFVETRGKPLLPELYKIEGLGILPSVQAQWSLVKKLIKEVTLLVCLCSFCYATLLHCYQFILSFDPLFNCSICFALLCLVGSGPPHPESRYDSHNWQIRKPRPL
jgi:hypothetical protein